MKFYSRRTSAQIQHITYGPAKGIHVYTLQEDVSLAVGNVGSKFSDALRLEASSREAEEKIAKGFGANHSHGTGSIRDFIRGTAREIACFGETWNEVAFDLESRSFRVVQLLPETLIPLPIYALQVLRSDDSACGRQLAWIPRRALLHITAPGIAPRTIRRMIGALTALEKAQKSGWNLMNLSMEGTSGYDFVLHSQRANEALLRACGPVSYTPRTLSNDPLISQVNAAYRYAHFQAFCRRLRLGMIDIVNEILMNAGDQLGFTATVRSTAGLSPEDWERAASEVLRSSDPMSIVNSYTSADRHSQGNGRQH